MEKRFSLTEPNIKAKILGSILCITGLVLLLNPSSLYIKIGFSSILIGVFLIFIITEKTIPQKLSNAQIKGNIEAIKNITNELNLSGNAVFIPKNNILNTERVFIPLEKSNLRLPEIDDDFVFSTGIDGKSMGISIPPSGQELLYEVEKDIDFTKTEDEKIEEKLQSFVGMDIVKSVSFKKLKDGWNLELEKPIFCTKDQDLCNKYPCPACSAIISAIAKASEKRVTINRANYTDAKTTFNLRLE